MWDKVFSMNVCSHTVQDKTWMDVALTVNYLAGKGLRKSKETKQNNNKKQQTNRLIYQSINRAEKMHASETFTNYIKSCD